MFDPFVSYFQECHTAFEGRSSEVILPFPSVNAAEMCHRTLWTWNCCSSALSTATLSTIWYSRERTRLVLCSRAYLQLQAFVEFEDEMSAQFCVATLQAMPLQIRGRTLFAQYRSVREDLFLVSVRGRKGRPAGELASLPADSAFPAGLILKLLLQHAPRAEARASSAQLLAVLRGEPSPPFSSPMTWGFSLRDDVEF